MFDTREDLFREQKQREYKHLDLILDNISKYKKGSSSLRILTESLELLLYQLEETEREWRKKYWDYFEPILLEYDYSVVDKKPYLSLEGQRRVNEGLNGIEQMVKERIKLYEPYLNDWDSSNF